MTYFVIRELLVSVVRGASPDLEFGTIGRVSTGNIQAFGPENLDSSTAECPLLSCSSGTALDGDDGAIGIGCSGQTFIYGQ